MSALSHDQLMQFAERGFVVVPGVVSPDLTAAARRTVDSFLVENPPPEGKVGAYFPPVVPAAPLFDLLVAGGALELARSLTANDLEVPPDVQVALNFPHYLHKPGRHHLDCNHNDPDGDPWTFTLLVAVLLSDQLQPNSGNLWVWPGTHLAHEAWFRREGAGALVAHGGYPPIDLPAAEQVLGRTGDVLLAHYMLGHNIGGNMSPTTRYAAYFRTRRAGHTERWQQCMTEAWTEFDGLRSALPELVSSG